MKILYVGNFTQAHCTEVHIATTLEDLGHLVTRIQEDPSNANYMEKVKDHDLFLFTRTWNNLVTLEHLEQMKQLGIPSVSYHLDLYVGLQRQDGLDFDPFWKTQYVFSPDGDPASQAVFESKGINHHYMKPAVYKGDCYIVDNPKTKDVIFVGSKGYHAEWPYRPQLITWLRDNYGERFEHWGNDGLGTVRNDLLNQLYASTRVVVGDSLCLGFTHPYYWSDRAYETLGRGGFLIHPFIEGMDEEFEDGKHLVFYKFGDFDDLKSKIDFYIQNEEAREYIRSQGHEFVKNHATYHDRLKQMLEIVNGK